MLEKMRLPYREDTYFSTLTFLIFIIPLAFTWYSYEKFETIKISLLFILLGSAAWLLAKKMYSGGFSVKINKAVLAVVAFMGVLLVVSTLFSGNWLNGFLGVNPRFTSGLLFYIAFLVFFVFLLIGLTKDKFIFLLKVLVADAWIVSVVGILQSKGIAFYQGLDVPGFQRGPSLLGNPNFSTMFVVMILPVTIYFLSIARTKWSRVYYAFAALSAVISVVALSSRGAWLGSVLVLLLGAVAAVMTGNAKKLIMLQLLALVLGVGLWYITLPQTRPQTVQQTLNFTDVNISSRIYVWDIARQAIMEHPLLGVGPGNFQYYFQSHREKTLADQGGVYDDVHNIFLQLGASVGLPFLLSFVFLIVFLCLRAIQQARKQKDFLPIAVALGVVGFCVMGSFTPVASACFMALIVMFAGLAQPYIADRHISPNKILASTTALTGLAFLMLGICFLLSELIFYRGYIAYFDGNYAKASQNLKIAGYFNPKSQLIQIYAAATGLQLGDSPAKTEMKMQKFISLYPQDVRGYIAASNISYMLFERTGDKKYLQKPIDYMNTVLHLDPNNAVRYSGAALYYYAANKLPEALDYDKYALSLNEDNVPGWILLAKIYQLQGNVHASRASINKVYGLRPDIPLLKAVHDQAEATDDKEYSKVSIPVLYNPNQIE